MNKFTLSLFVLCILRVTPPVCLNIYIPLLLVRLTLCFVLFKYSCTSFYCTSMFTHDRTISTYLSEDRFVVMWINKRVDREKQRNRTKQRAGGKADEKGWECEHTHSGSNKVLIIEGDGM